MFYEPAKQDHGLRRDPFKGLVVPRPIGWISSLDADGIANLAPYSFFNAVSEDPPCVMFSTSLRDDGTRKDSHSNAEHTGEFVVNLATFAHREAMNVSATPVAAGESEFALAGIEMEPSRLVKPPRVKGAPASLECRYIKTVSLPGRPGGRVNVVVLGQVVGVHVDDGLVVDGRVEIVRARPIARLGNSDYAVVDEVFQMRRTYAHRIDT